MEPQDFDEALIRVRAFARALGEPLNDLFEEEARLAWEDHAKGYFARSGHDPTGAEAFWWLTGFVSGYTCPTRSEQREAN